MVAAIDKKIEMEIVLQYPALSPIQLVFANPDGSTNKTVKFVLYDIDGRVKSATPWVIDFFIIDVLFFLHFMVFNNQILLVNYPFSSKPPC